MLPPGPVAVRDTEYWPVPLKTTWGFCDAAVVPSTKLTVEGENDQFQDVGKPMDWSVKITVVAGQVVVLLAAKFAAVPMFTVKEIVFPADEVTFEMSIFANDPSAKKAYGLVVLFNSVRPVSVLKFA